MIFANIMVLIFLGWMVMVWSHLREQTKLLKQIADKE